LQKKKQEEKLTEMLTMTPGSSNASLRPRFTPRAVAVPFVFASCSPSILVSPLILVLLLVLVYALREDGFGFGGPGIGIAIVVGVIGPGRFWFF
jgi:hypothetical protein